MVTRQIGEWFNKAGWKKLRVNVCCICSFDEILPWQVSRAQSETTK